MIRNLKVYEITNGITEAIPISCDNKEWNVCVHCDCWNNCMFKCKNFPGYASLITKDIKELRVRFHKLGKRISMKMQKPVQFLFWIVCKFECLGNDFLKNNKKH